MNKEQKKRYKQLRKEFRETKGSSLTCEELEELFRYMMKYASRLTKISMIISKICMILCIACAVASIGITLCRIFG